MPKGVLRYIHGTPHEVSSGMSSRSYSNIENAAVREALLAPPRNQHAVFVLGGIREYQYPFIPKESETQLKELESSLGRYAQEALSSFAETQDPFPFCLMNIVYDPRRISLLDLKKQLPHDPLNRIVIFSSSDTPKPAKEVLERQNFSSYPLYISGVQKPESEDLQKLEQLKAHNNRFGLTRIEALQRIVLEQCSGTPSKQFMGARSHFIHLFSSLDMLYQVEQELLSHYNDLAKAI